MLNLSFTAPAAKTLENDSYEKGVLTDCGTYAPEQYRHGAKSRAEQAGNSSKACCPLILLKTLAPPPTRQAEYRALPLNCQAKNLYKTRFVWGGKYLTDKRLQRFGPPLSREKSPPEGPKADFCFLRKTILSHLTVS